MYIRVDDTGGVLLEDSENFRELKIQVRHSPAKLSLLQEWLKEVADPVGLDHAWVSIDWLRARSAAGASIASTANFNGMIEFARKQGWLNDQGSRVRSHLEWEEPD